MYLDAPLKPGWHKHFCFLQPARLQISEQKYTKVTWETIHCFYKCKSLNNNIFQRKIKIFDMHERALSEACWTVFLTAIWPEVKPAADLLSDWKKTDILFPAELLSTQMNAHVLIYWTE